MTRLQRPISYIRTSTFEKQQKEFGFTRKYHRRPKSLYSYMLRRGRALTTAKIPLFLLVRARRSAATWVSHSDASLFPFAAHLYWPASLAILKCTQLFTRRTAHTRLGPISKQISSIGDLAWKRPAMRLWNDIEKIVPEPSSFVACCSQCPPCVVLEKNRFGKSPSQWVCAFACVFSRWFQTAFSRNRSKLRRRTKARNGAS